MFVPDVLNIGLKRFPNASAVAEAGRCFDYVTLNDRCELVCALLHEHGVRSGDRIALLAKNEIEFFELQIGAQRYGAIFVPLNYRLSRPEIRYILEDCSPALLFAGPEHEADAHSFNVPVIELRAGEDGDYLSKIIPLDSKRTAMLSSSTPAQILYTSGTTGRPKGAVINNGAFCGRYTSYAIELRAQADDVFVQCLPAFHLAGTFCFAFLLVGAAVELVRKVDGPAILDLLTAKSATVVHLVPTILQDLIRDRDAAMRAGGNVTRILCGGSASSRDLIADGCRLLGADCIHLYGLTEAGAATKNWISCYTTAISPESVGYDMIGFETRIATSDGSDVEPGATGEILIRGVGTMEGYWNDPLSSAASLRDGWVSTGDCGMRDLAGCLYITDRIKDMIISGGENVYSVEVETALLADPSVAECAVIAAPDERLGERVHAVVVFEVESGGSIDGLVARCRTQLGGYKRPRSWTVLKSIPRNAMGKVAKAELRAQVGRGELPIIRA